MRVEFTTEEAAALRERYTTEIGMLAAAITPTNISIAEQTAVACLLQNFLYSHHITHTLLLAECPQCGSTENHVYRKNCMTLGVPAHSWHSKRADLLRQLKEVRNLLRERDLLILSREDLRKELKEQQAINAANILKLQDMQALDKHLSNIHAQFRKLLGIPDAQLMSMESIFSTIERLLAVARLAQQFAATVHHRK